MTTASPPHLPTSHQPFVPQASPSNVPGILALTFGVIALLIAWVPVCGSIPALGLTLAGIPLGIWGIAIASRTPRLGKALPVSGLVISSLALVVAAASTLAPVLLITGAAKAIAALEEAERERRAAAVVSPAPFADAAVYYVESENHLAGRGFIVSTAGGLFAITAAHAFEDEKPITLLTPGFDPENEVALADIAHHVGDVLALRLAPGESPPASATLQFPGTMPVEQGDRIVILTMEGPVYATVSVPPFSTLPGAAQLDAPLEAATLSGSPVVLEATGTVVGVLVGADDLERASNVTFVKLRLPTGPSGPARPDR